MKRFYISRLMIPIIILLGAVSGANAQTNYTTPGGPYTYTVPVGITSIGIDMQGGNGGQGYSGATNGAGGKGARVQSTLSGLTGGQVLYIYVGGGGTNYSSGSIAGGACGGGTGYSNGGGGGGASDIRTNNTGASYSNATSLASRIVVAGGGGGGGENCGSSYLETGGAGGLVGGNGNECGSPYNYYTGTGATISGGGLNATYCSSATGTLGVGGSNTGCTAYGGGGGGGYYGGGYGAYGGGGGGSSYPSVAGVYSGVTVGSLINTTGYNTSTGSGTGGNGIVTIYGPTAFVSPSALAFGGVTVGTTSIPPSFFTITGTYMPASGTISVMPPANFNVSLDGITWYSVSGGSGTTAGPLSVPFTATSGAMNPVNVYVQFAPTATIPYSGNVGVYGGVLSTTTNVAVSGTGVTACAGAPAAGSSTVSPTSGQSITVFSLGLTPAPTAGGLTYQWQSAPATSGPWTAVPGGVTATTTYTGLTATTYFRCIVTCASTGASTTYSGAVATFATTAASSCSPTDAGNISSVIGAYVGTSAYPLSITGAGGTSISDPTLPNAGINASGCYNDESSTAYTCTFTPGFTYQTTMGPNTPASNQVSYQIWIDFNNGGAFETSEIVGGVANFSAFAAGGRATPTITIPSGIPFGVYRMRIICAYSNGNAAGNANYPAYPSIPPCPTATVQYADIRDYQVTIGNPPCSGIPNPGIVSSTALVGCNTISPSIFSVGATAGAGISYTWQQNTGSGFGPAGSTSTYFNPTISSSGTPYTISYRMFVTCGANSAFSPAITVTVNPAPTTILGVASACTGLSTTLSSTPTGGIWTTSDPTIATANSTSGAITGVSPGTATITYAAPITGCTITTPVTVNQNPTAITGTPVVCRGSVTTLSDGVGGGSWTTGASFVATVDAGGNVTGVASSFATTLITYTLPTSCKVTQAFTVNGLPTQYVVSGGGTICAGSPSTYHVNLSLSTPGVNYQLFLSGSPVGLPMAGTGGGLDFGVQSADGVYTVIATNTTTGCTSSMINTASISHSSLPLPYTVSVAGGVGSYCAGTGGIHIVTDGSQIGVNDSLFQNGVFVAPVVGGTGAAIDFGPQSGTSTYTVKAVNAAGCVNNYFGAATVLQNPLPQLHTVTGGGGYCLGTSGDTISLDGSNTGVTYTLWNGGSTAATLIGTGAHLNFGYFTTLGTYSVIATNTTTGCTQTMLRNAVVSSSPLPNTYSLSSDSSYCSGTGGRHVDLLGSDAGTNYQLFVGSTPSGAAITGGGSTVDFGAQTAPGVYTVVATDPATGCIANMPGSTHITISTLPATQTLTGGGSFCVGGTGRHITLLGSVPGVSYTLYTGGTPVSTIAGTGSALDFGLIATTGTYTATGTNVTTTCSVNMTGVSIIAANPLPAQFNVTGTGNYCVGTSGLDVQLDFSSTGVNYQLYKNDTAIGAPLAGIGGSLDFGTQTIGSYTVIGTNPSTTCVNTMNGAAVVSVNPLPTNYLVTGGGSFCAGASGIPVGLNGSNTGINYQLFNGITPVGSAMAGTGSTLNFGLQTAAGSYTIQAVDGSSLCARTMPGGAVVVVNPLPNTFFLTGGGIFCAGASGVHVGLNSSNTGISYQLINGGTATGSAVIGTGLALDFGLQNAAGSYTVLATNTTSGCQSAMTGSSTVATNPVPTVYSVLGGGAFCAGGTGPDVSLTGSDAGINYQLYRGTTMLGAPSAGTGGSLDFGIESAAGTYTVKATDATTGCGSNMASSANIVINPLPLVSSVSGGGSFCASGTGVHVFLGVSVPGVNYQLYNGGVAVGAAMPGTGGGLDFGLTTTAGAYTVEATNALTGCSADMTGSATVAINPLPAVHSVTGGGGYCTGGTGVHIGLDGSETGITYRLSYGGTIVGSAVSGTGSSVDLGDYTGVGSYSVSALNTATGCTSNMSGVANVAIVAPPTAYSITGGGNYCATGLGVHVGLASSDAGVNYQLFKGTTPIGIPEPGTGSSIDFGLELAPGSYTITAANPTTGCNSNMTGATVVNVIPVVLPHVTLASSTGGSTVCTGTNVTFTASPINGGSAPTYQWFINGVNAGIGSTYAYLPNNGDVVTALMTSNEQCAIPDTGSLSMTMTVSPLEMPSVNVTANPGNVVCTGAPASFTAATLYAGTSPVLRWIKNGAFVATGTSYTYTPANGDIIAFMLGSDYPCLLTDTVYSNNITMAVSNGVVPVVAINANPGSSISEGESVTFTAVTTTGGSHPTYQWLVNNHMVAGATASTFTTNTLQNNDSVTCEVTGTCALVGINSVHMHVSDVSVTQVSNGNSDVKLIPNPNKGDFSIRGTVGTIDEEVSVDVVNMIGQVVYTGKITAQNGAIDQHIQLGNNLANGMYILNLHSVAGNTIFHFVIEK